MKKLMTSALLGSAALALAACGSADDASEDAMADTVEMPAEEAMSDAPAPVADENATADDAMAATEADAMDAAAEAEDMVEDDVEAAIDNAEAEMQ